MATLSKNERDNITEKSITESSNTNENIRLPILIYHHVLNTSSMPDTLFVTPQELESDFKYLSENKYNTITMDTLIQYVHNNKSIPDNPIILSFDDGYLNNYVYVFPLLKKYGFNAVFSIIGNSTDKFTQKKDINLEYSYATWDQIKEMAESGIIEIQNHSYNLHSMNGHRVGCSKINGEPLNNYEMDLYQDIGNFQTYLYQKTGKTPSTFSYPFGYISKESVDILKKIGFKASFSSNGGINKITKNPDCLFLLKRNNRPHGISTQNFFKKLSSFT
jgi:peptidoglycan/xylan/chitin deacetylase (PgdA/CDA1 family)